MKPTKANLLQGTPDKYFIYEKGADLIKFMNESANPGGVGKEYLGHDYRRMFPHIPHDEDFDHS